MSNNAKKNQQEFSLLLPWYAAGTLDEKLMGEINSALERDPALRHQLELVLQDQGMSNELTSEIVVPESMVARFDVALNQQIENEIRISDKSQNAPQGGWLTNLIAGLLPPQRLAYAAIAAVLLIVVQSGTILGLLQTASNQPTEYQTASSNIPADSSDNGFVVLVRFSDGASMEDIYTYLKANELSIIQGPISGGMFRIAMSLNKARDEAISDVGALASILSMQTDVFTLVLPAK